MVKMEEVYRRHSPTEPGQYLVYSSQGCIYFVAKDVDDRYMYSSGGLKLDRETWRLYDEDSVYDVYNVKPLDECIDRNIDVDMAYRERLVGKEIVIDGETFKIVRIVHHIHAWTVFDTECGKRIVQITIHDRDKVFLESEGGWVKIDTKLQ